MTVESACSLVMHSRQNGRTLSSMLENAPPFENGRKIVFDAYREHRVVGNELKKMIITEFANKWFGECMRNPAMFLNGLKLAN